MKSINIFLFCFLLWIPIFALGQNIVAKSSFSIKEKRDYLQKVADSSFAHSFNGQYNDAIRTNLRLLKYADELDDPYYLHRGYSLLGYNYLVTGDNLKAKESFLKSESYALKANDTSALGRNYLDLANLYLLQKKIKDSSFQYYDKAISLLEKAKDSAGLASAHYYAIVANLDAKKYDKARDHIENINKYINNIEDDNFCEISVNSQKAKYHTALGEYSLADIYFNQVIEDSKKKEFLIELENTYLTYSKSLFSQGRYKESFLAQEKYVDYLKENLQKRFSEENAALISKFELEKYKKEVAEKEKEKELINKIAESKTNSNILLTILIIALLCTFVYLIFLLDKKKKLLKNSKLQNEKYREAKKEAERLNKSKQKFLSTVSHELRTPLYGVIGLSTILLEDEKLPHQKESLKSLKFSADYLLSLINDVLSINKIDTHQKEQKTTFCIRKLVESIITSFHYKKKKNNNRIHLSIDDTIPDLIAGDDGLLSQILMNLIGNAYKFTQDGDIYVNLKPTNITDEDLNITFTIRDTGIGISEEDQILIFDEFTQAKNKIGKEEQGSGLGLSIVKKLLAQYGAKIKLTSELGKGSVFSFTLRFDLIEHKVTSDYVPSVSFADISILKGKYILIVDDNTVNRVVTEKILEKEGVKTKQAVNGEEAVTLVSSQKFDLVLMDVNMPVKDGITAAKEIRLFNKNIPIIALTAVEMDTIKNRIYESGMNDIVLKPYSLPDFHKVLINNILQSESNGQLQLTTSSRVFVRRNGDNE